MVLHSLSHISPQRFYDRGAITARTDDCGAVQLFLRAGALEFISDQTSAPGKIIHVHDWQTVVVTGSVVRDLCAPGPIDDNPRVCYTSTKNVRAPGSVTGETSVAASVGHAPAGFPAGRQVGRTIRNRFRGFGILELMKRRHFVFSNFVTTVSPVMPEEVQKNSALGRGLQANEREPQQQKIRQACSNGID